MAATVVTEGETIEMPKGITEDYGWTQKPRNFQANCRTLDRLGCDDYDKYQKLIELKFPKHEQAYYFFKKKLHTADKNTIEKFIKLGVLRDVVGIQSRNQAKKYALSKKMSEKDWQSDGAQNADA